jgi:hypothetical protein
MHTDVRRIQGGMCCMDVTTQLRLLWLGSLAALYVAATGTGLLDRYFARSAAPFWVSACDAFA